MTKLVTSNGRSIDQLAAELGAAQQSSGGTSASRMPELKINTQVDDDQGNSLPRGHFYIKGLDKVAYGETVEFRPLGHHYQYLHYDTQQNKLAAKSLIISNFGQEARDTNGTVRCGKPISSVLREMPDAQRQKYADITCFRQVRGLVTFTGVTAEGEKVEYVNQPVILMLKGTNWAPFEDEFLKKLPRNRNIWDYTATITSERHKNGSVTWFTFHFKPDLKNPVSLTQDVVDSMGAIADAIRAENARIDQAYKAALTNQSLDQNAIDAMESALEDDLEDVA